MKKTDEIRNLLKVAQSKNEEIRVTTDGNKHGYGKYGFGRIVNLNNDNVMLSNKQGLTFNYKIIDILEVN